MKKTADSLEQLLPAFDEKTQKKYHIQTFINLCNKLDDTEDDEIIRYANDTFELLCELKGADRSMTRTYIKSFAGLQKLVRQKLGYTAKEQLKGEYTGMGIALGLVFGVPFMSINPAFSGIGLPIGLAIGIAIGEKKEKEAVEKGLVY